MITWFAQNLGSIIVTIILVVIVALIIRTLISDKKQGRSSCGANCSHCAMCGSCHQKRKPVRPKDNSKVCFKKAS